jgi:hypothetical protein
MVSGAFGTSVGYSFRIETFQGGVHFRTGTEVYVEQLLAFDAVVCVGSVFHTI